MIKAQLAGRNYYELAEEIRDILTSDVMGGDAPQDFMRKRIEQIIEEYCNIHWLAVPSWMEMHLAEYTPAKLRDRYADYFQELGDLTLQYEVMLAEVWLSWWDRTKIGVGTQRFREILARYGVGAEQPFVGPDGTSTDDVRFFGPSRNVAMLARDFYRGNKSTSDIKRELKQYGDITQATISSLPYSEQQELRGKLLKTSSSMYENSVDGDIVHNGRYHYELVKGDTRDWVNEIGFTVKFEQNDPNCVVITRRDDFSIFSKTVVSEELVVKTSYRSEVELVRIIVHQLKTQLANLGHDGAACEIELNQKLPIAWPASENAVCVVKYDTDRLLQKVYISSVKFQYTN